MDFTMVTDVATQMELMDRLNVHDPKAQFIEIEIINDFAFLKRTRWERFLKEVVLMVSAKYRTFEHPFTELSVNNKNIATFFEAIQGRNSTVTEAAFLRIRKVTICFRDFMHQDFSQIIKIKVTCHNARWCLDCADCEFVINLKNSGVVFKSLKTSYNEAMRKQATMKKSLKIAA